MDDIREHFKKMRFDKRFHLGMGDIRLPISDQEEICDMVEQLKINVDLGSVSKSANINNCTNCSHYVSNNTRQDGQAAHYCKAFVCLGGKIRYDCLTFKKHSC